MPGAGRDRPYSGSSGSRRALRLAVVAVGEVGERTKLHRIADACRYDTECAACDEPQLTPNSICVPMVAHGRTLGSITLDWPVKVKP